MKKYRATVFLTAIALSLTLFSLTPTALAASPVAENQELCTYRGISVGGRLSAYDVDGGNVTYQIITEPVKGEIKLGEDGRFVYTPFDGKKGRDYFSYTASDSDGNVSQEATVIIQINKQKTSVTYSDLDGSPAQYAAIVLAEEGIFTGECICGEYVFDAGRQITREELLSMCMKLADEKLIRAVRSTGFTDDDEIDAWARPYVATASMKGYVSGYVTETGLEFGGDRGVTGAEAVVMLNNVFGLTDVPESVIVSNESIPVWAAQASANLDSCDIFCSDAPSAELSLTRAQAAELLCTAISVLEKR